MGTPLVIVESPAKARTIARFLGDEYRVEASVGHIRDLAAKPSELTATEQKIEGSKYSVAINDGFKPLYVIPKTKKAQVKRLREWMKDASAVYLATDEDREGESISWHLLEVLKPKVPVFRLVFHEITSAAIQRAMESPRAVNENLVRAQETRRIVDRLFGYPVSALLWIKVGPGLSAGRVQSVAVRLVVERERARMAHTSAEWWDLRARFLAGDEGFDAVLTQWQNNKLATGKDFNDQGQLKGKKGQVVIDAATAQQIADDLKDKKATVDSVESRPFTERPSPPFTTSTLQQMANRRFKWTARRTMNAAQRLYENGWITYMRTDATTLSAEALDAARSLIRKQYGDDHLPDEVRVYKSKAKNAQEAHEAIRPAGAAFRTLADAKGELGPDEFRLYEVIWKRTVACQMKDAKGKNATARIAVGDAIFEAKGKTIEFHGFRRAYAETAEETGADLSDQERMLPSMDSGDGLDVDELETRQHATKPPPRLTEASLVKELEERGIGRPSTYATIIDTILRRDYVFKKGSALVPTWTAFAVTGLLEAPQFKWLVDYDFTAQMEEGLDAIVDNPTKREVYLSKFWTDLTGSLDKGKNEIDPRQICTMNIGTVDPDSAKKLGVEKDEAVVVRVGKYGPFLQCGERTANIPDDLAPDELSVPLALELLQGPKVLGMDENSDMEILLENGRFGWYVQLGRKEDQEKPKRKSVPRGMKPGEVDLETGAALLSLPRDIGPHPEDKEPVMVDYGRYGAFVKWGKETRSVRDKDPFKVLTLTLEEALALLAKPKGRKRAEVLRELGKDPSTERAVNLMEGRYGPYATDGETNASIGKDADPQSVTLAQAIELIRAREKAPKRKKSRRRS